VPAPSDVALDSPAHWVRIGVLTKAHGIKGEIAIHLDNPDGDVLVDGLVVRLEAPANAGRAQQAKPPVLKTVTRVFAGGVKLALDGVVSRDAADALRGAVVFARREDFPEPDDDELYLVDFVGAEVVTTTGERLGFIRDFSENGAQPLARVADAHGRVTDMPFVAGLVVRIDDANDNGPKRVIVDPPEGLFAGEAIVVERSADDDHDDETDDETDNSRDDAGKNA
jgi:16S rRNA processing protein RimM